MPPQQRIDEHWYQGTADAVYQNIYTLEKERPEYVVILAGDHIYKMDYCKLVELPQGEPGRSDDRRPARATPPRPRQFGVMEIDADQRIVGFEEKPAEPQDRFPAIREHALASMGIYVFTARFLFEQLCLDATRPDSEHDFGRNIIPVDDRHAPRVRLPVPRREPQEGRLLARRGHARRLLRGQHGPDRRSIRS